MSGRRAAAVEGLLAVGFVLLAPASARADHEAFGVAVGLAGIVVPSDAGLAFTDVGPRFLLGWSLQLPLDLKTGQHRVVGGLDWIPDGAADGFRARMGYRFALAKAPLFGGLGLSLDDAGTSWSPELGVNLLGRPDDMGGLAMGPFLHLLVRTEIAPALNAVRGGSVLVGWTFL